MEEAATKESGGNERHSKSVEPLAASSMGSAPLVKASKTCLLVLGMHRSGTSAVCGVLHQLGADRPLREMPPQLDNEKGFFEPVEISAIHDRMLASAGLYWFDWEPMPQSWYACAAHDAFVNELVNAAQIDFPGQAPFLLKDPRICRFVDVWLEVLDRLGTTPVVVFQYRDPIEVAQSLKVRDGFSISHGLLMWLRHILQGEKASRNLERSFINFGNLLVDWQAELAGVIGSSQIALPKRSARAMAKAGDFLDGSLRHQVRKPSVSDLVLHGWFEQSFVALERLRIDPYDGEAMATLDTIHDAFDAASAAFSPVFQQLLLQVDALGQAAGRSVELEAALAASSQTLAAAASATERLPAAEAELAETLRSIAALQPLADRVPSLEVSLAEAHSAHSALKAMADQIPNLEAELAAARHALAAVQPSLDRIPTLEAEIAVAHHSNATLQEAAERVPIVEAELAAARQALAAVQPSLDRIPMLEAEIAVAHHLNATLQEAAERVPIVEAELAAARHALAAVQPSLDRIPTLEAEIAAAHHLNATLQEAAERVPIVEAELAAARQALVAVQPSLDRIPILEAEIAAAHHSNATLQVAAGRVPILEADLGATQQALDAAHSIADRVPQIESERERAWQALAVAQSTADRIPGLEDELAEMRGMHAEAERIAESVPSLKAELAHVHNDLAAIRPTAERVPGLEADLAAASQRIIELQHQLDETTLKLNGTIGSRFATAARFIHHRAK